LATKPRSLGDVLQEFSQYRQLMQAELQKVIIGQDEVIEQLFAAIFTRGHCLLVGVPGLAKTLLISSLARTLDLSFNRIQFTPDLLPGDITGTDLLHVDGATGDREFRFAPGPVFANVVLADEINRTPPKTQAALLESMMEKQVTVGGRRHPLPEAQLDRFMFMIQVGYPTLDEEREILRRTTGDSHVELDRVLDGVEIRAMQDVVRGVPMADHVFDYALALTRGTRVRSDAPLTFLKNWVNWGAGPRASQFLVLGAKAHAALEGRTHAAIEDVQAVVKPVLRHRIVTTFQASAEGISSDDIIDRLVQEVDPGATVGAGVPGVPRR
jgi:MoxR-like ATPase